MALLAAATLASDFLAAVNSNDSATLAVLGRLLARAESRVATRLGYPGASPSWESATYVLRTEALRGDTRRLLLPVAPVTSITSVYQDLDMAFGASTLVASGDYELEALPTGAYLHLLPSSAAGEWYTTSRTIKVTCVAGYANEAAIPKALAEAVYQWAADTWQRRSTRQQTSFSQGNINLGLRELDVIPPDLEVILAAWQLMGTVGAS